MFTANKENPTDDIPLYFDAGEFFIYCGEYYGQRGSTIYREYITQKNNPEYIGAQARINDKEYNEIYYNHSVVIRDFNLYLDGYINFAKHTDRQEISLSTGTPH